MGPGGPRSRSSRSEARFVPIMLFIVRSPFFGRNGVAFLRQQTKRGDVTTYSRLYFPARGTCTTTKRGARVFDGSLCGLGYGLVRSGKRKRVRHVELLPPLPVDIWRLGGVRIEPITTPLSSGERFRIVNEVFARLSTTPVTIRS